MFVLKPLTFLSLYIPSCRLDVATTPILPHWALPGLDITHQLRHAAQLCTPTFQWSFGWCMKGAIPCYPGWLDSTPKNIGRPRYTMIHNYSTLFIIFVALQTLSTMKSHPDPDTVKKKHLLLLNIHCRRFVIPIFSTWNHQGWRAKSYRRNGRLTTFGPTTCHPSSWPSLT